MTARSDDRRAVVLTALREHSAGVSGEVLAARIGVSRVAVRKHVEALRVLGYEIEARSGEGYRLVSAPDAPLPLEVAPLLATDLFVRLEGGHTTGSTNEDARALAIAGAPEGTTVLACRQTAGRGRLGREWHSPAGGVYCSSILRPAVETPDGMVLPLVVGLGVARGLATLGVDVRLKWPNDVLSADGRKLAGILMEGHSEGWRVCWVVAGVGVNVRHSLSEFPATCLDELTGEPVPLARVCAAVLDGVADAYREWQACGFAPLRTGYEAVSWLTGRDVVVSDALDRVVADGRVSGVDEHGRLLVETADGTVSVAAGDVTLRR